MTPCYDCGSPLSDHHTPLCDLAGPKAIRDLPQVPGTQHWDQEAEQPLAILKYQERERMRKKAANEPGAKKTPERTIFWQRECTYISEASEQRGEVPEMQPGGKETFIRYCEMQRDAAQREGYDDSAQYIQHCLDDLKG